MNFFSWNHTFRIYTTGGGGGGDRGQNPGEIGGGNLL